MKTVRVTYTKNGTQYMATISVASVTKSAVEIEMLKKQVGRSQIKSFVEA